MTAHGFGLVFSSALEGETIPSTASPVRFTLTPDQLAYWNRDMQEVNEPGPVAVHVGNSSASLRSAGLVVA